MTSISAVDTSLYPGLVEGFAPKSTMPVPAVETEPQQDGADYYGGGYSSQDPDYVDLSNYYNEVRPEDLLTKAGQYLVESAQKVDNAMVVAMQNGFSVQDVCNMKLAEIAYKANAYVFDIAADISTFELKI